MVCWRNVVSRECLIEVVEYKKSDAAKVLSIQKGVRDSLKPVVQLAFLSFASA